MKSESSNDDTTSEQEGSDTDCGRSRNQGTGPRRSEDTVTLTMRKSYLYVLLALALGLGGGLGLGNLLFSSSSSSPEALPQVVQQSGTGDTQESNAVRLSPDTVQTQEQPSLTPLNVEGRPFKGPEDAPVTIVEFTDYECPYCGRHFRDTMPQILSEYEGKIKYVIMNFPLYTIHFSAVKAAEAAECAYDQGKFWEYHDLLFENQSAVDAASLKKYAADLGLDTEAFNTCLDSEEKKQQVSDDLQAGQRAGVQGTPTFFVNDQRLVGAQPFSSFQAIIDAALGSAFQQR